MIAIVYGSTADHTRDAAAAIAESLRPRSSMQVDVIDVATIKDDLTPLLNYHILIVGCPTWNIGELQDDWYDTFPQLDALDFGEMIVALFGCGDQHNFPDNFQDAIGILGHKLRERGAELVGRWPTEGYDFSESQALEDGMFIGLALDDDNEPQLTPQRIEAWVTQLVGELQLEPAAQSAAS